MHRDAHGFAVRNIQDDELYYHPIYKKVSKIEFKTKISIKNDGMHVNELKYQE
jgi:hypothetical protein